MNEPKKLTYIKCTCGSNLFIEARMLGPGTKKPDILDHVWVCVGCGMKYLPDDFPKKGEDERKESKILLPDKKLKVMN